MPAFASPCRLRAESPREKELKTTWRGISSEELEKSRSVRALPSDLKVEAVSGGPDNPTTSLLYEYSIWLRYSV